MTNEQLKARVAELEIATQDMQRVLDNVRQYADILTEPVEEEDMDRCDISNVLYHLLKGYGSSHS